MSSKISRFSVFFFSFELGLNLVRRTFSKKICSQARRLQSEFFFSFLFFFELVKLSTGRNRGATTFASSSVSRGILLVILDL
ncbi:hypothetical protein GYMLUDRAFT_969456 [Collybiopsis luxurians FD-317 M1]|uniref:Uncharacterized protein n=1 Tax=Collybiopsis luxurians FD-317 M1 TaxID=944289 RepID=A0A0D0C363_9AGAR|nr:hypothetical protein GYMLUDRAFT_969456 [Collybiopsis luxurians FD-317 M1]